MLAAPADEATSRQLIKHLKRKIQVSYNKIDVCTCIIIAPCSYVVIIIIYLLVTDTRHSWAAQKEQRPGSAERVAAVDVVRHTSPTAETRERNSTGDELRLPAAVRARVRGAPALPAVWRPAPRAPPAPVPSRTPRAPAARAARAAAAARLPARPVRLRARVRAARPHPARRRAQRAHQPQQRRVARPVHGARRLAAPPPARAAAAARAPAAARQETHPRDLPERDSRQLAARAARARGLPAHRVPTQEDARRRDHGRQARQRAPRPRRLLLHRRLLCHRRPAPRRRPRPTRGCFFRGSKKLNEPVHKHRRGAGPGGTGGGESHTVGEGSDV